MRGTVERAEKDPKTMKGRLDNVYQGWKIWIQGYKT